MAKSLVLVLIVVLSNAVGQLVLKLGMNRMGRIGTHQLVDPVSLARALVVNPLVLTAVVLYAASFVIWAVVLSRVQVSLAYPMLSLTYAVVPVAAWLVLGETMGVPQWLGIGLVCGGVFLLTQGKGF